MSNGEHARGGGGGNPNSPREWPGAVAMVSNDLLCIKDELVWNRNGLEVSGTGLGTLLPEPRETHPLEGGGLDAAAVLWGRGGEGVRGGRGRRGRRGRREGGEERKGGGREKGKQ